VVIALTSIQFPRMVTCVEAKLSQMPAFPAAEMRQCSIRISVAFSVKITPFRKRFGVSLLRAFANKYHTPSGSWSLPTNSSPRKDSPRTGLSLDGPTICTGRREVGATISNASMGKPDRGQ
jgi:hypothetical protein